MVNIILKILIETVLFLLIIQCYMYVYSKTVVIPFKPV